MTLLEMNPSSTVSSSSVSRIIAWLRANLDQFSIQHIQDDTRLARLLKPLGELSLTAHIVAQYSDRAGLIALRQDSLDLLDYCWRQFAEGQRLVEFLSRYPHLLIYATIYPPFTHHGYRSPALEACLRRTITVHGYVEMEYPAWRALDLAVALEELNLPSPWKIADLFQRTWLYQMPEPWSLNEESAYAVTHTVFYMTDFGAQPERLPRQHSRYLALWAPAWQQYYFRQGHLDLAGELAMTLRCIGNTEDRLDFEKRLGAAQDEDGFIPGPPDAGLDLLDPGEIDAARRRFLQHYHTTLVGLMALVMSFQTEVHAREDQYSAHLG